MSDNYLHEAHLQHRITELETENVKLKNLLKKAIEDFETINMSFDVLSEESLQTCDSILECSTCPFSDGSICFGEWFYKTQALELIKESDPE